MLKFLSRLARELNWSRRSWSNASDEEFHDELYREDSYQPFSWGYPGYTTIRRFADIVEPLLPATGLVLDLGCGPGEITCELAGRRSDLTFVGIDHSASAIAKAETNAKRREVGNIRFERHNVEDYVPQHEIGLATLFDSFHHLTDPAKFVSRLALHVRRWALIEPRGSWAGRWQKDLDLDWLAHDLEKIRGHIEASVGSMGSRGSMGSGGSGSKGSKGSEGSAGSTSVENASVNSGRPAGLAVERRYTLDDFQRFFNGYALDLRGTVAGLESYPAGWNQPGVLRERFGRLQWELYREIDEWLYQRDLDLHAKHWLVVAERGGKSRVVKLTAPPRPDRHLGATAGGAHLAGQWDVRYTNYVGPTHAGAGERIFASVNVTNTGWDIWSSERAVFTSYHWLDESGRIVDFDGERTALPRPVGPGETCTVLLAVRTPHRAGRYHLAIDLVREGVTWFSEAGHPWLAVPFVVDNS